MKTKRGGVGVSQHPNPTPTNLAIHSEDNANDSIINVRLINWKCLQFSTWGVVKTQSNFAINLANKMFIKITELYQREKHLFIK